MASYDIRTLQQHLLEILKTIDKVCREHNLRYCLAAGTMLGAVRHKGFIPWDDDVDIIMPRIDYDILIQHCQEWMPAPYEIMCAENKSDYPFGFAKAVNSDTTLVEREHHALVDGIYIDIFPLDNIINNKLSQYCYTLRYSLYKKIAYLLSRNPYKHGHGPSCWIPLLCQRLFTLQDIMQRLLKLQTAYDGRETTLVIDHDFGMRGIMRKDIFSELSEVEFEGNTFKGIGQYDTYLHQLYGDYMTIPPHDEQHRHDFYLLDYNLPYRQYVDTRFFVSKLNSKV